MIVINFFGGPCSGKSTAAAGLFYMMKKEKYNVELVTEFAKDLTYDGHEKALSEQNFVFANQEYRLARLTDKVEIAISDSPLILSNIYASNNYPSSFKSFCLDMFDRYYNVNFFIERNHIYSQFGRNQNEKEADEKSKQIMNYLLDNKIPFQIMKAGDDVPEKVYTYLKDIEYI